MAKLRKKLYVIGVDSAPLWMIRKLGERYNMKGFEMFLESGSLVELESTMPPVSSPAWASMYSGLEPKEHEVMDFLHIDRKYTKQLIYYDSEKEGAVFWRALAKKGLRCLVVTPPMILTKSNLSRIDLVTGWPLSPSYSSGELEKAAKKFEFNGEPHFGSDFEEGKLSIAQMSERYVKSCKARAGLAEYLMTRKDYDFVFVCFTETDRIQHFAFREKGDSWEKYIAPIYSEISTFIERVMRIASQHGEEAEVMLLSDHGTQIIDKEFLINAWLVNHGYATLKEKVYEKYVRQQRNAVKRGFDAKRFIINKALKIPYRRKMYDIMPSSMKKVANDVLERGTDQKRSDSRYMKILEADFDMRKTQAFASISYGAVGMIWINDGRFSIPGTSEAKRVKSGIVRGLKGIKDEKGERLVAKIVDGKTYYKGAHSFIAPDILVLLAEGYVVDFSYYSKSELLMDPESARTGDHTMYGVFGMITSRGKAVRVPRTKGMKISEVKGIIERYFS